MNTDQQSVFEQFTNACNRLHVAADKVRAKMDELEGNTHVALRLEPVAWDVFYEDDGRFAFTIRDVEQAKRYS